MHKRIRQTHWLKLEQGGIQETMLESHHTHALTSTADTVFILFLTFHTWDKTIKHQKSTPPHWWAIASQMDFSFLGKKYHMPKQSWPPIYNKMDRGLETIIIWPTTEQNNKWMISCEKEYFFWKLSMSFLGGHQVPSNILRQEDERLQVTCNKWYPEAHKYQEK